MEQYHWEKVEREELGPGLARQVIHTDRLTVARIFLDKGAVVRRHQHENEQVTMIQRGRLRFEIDGAVREAGAGEVVRIPPDAPHAVEALEDTLAIDVFCPRREDWIRGDDAYLRG